MHAAKPALRTAKTFVPTGGSWISVEGKWIPSFMFQSTVIILVALKPVKGGK